MSLFTVVKVGILVVTAGWSCDAVKAMSWGRYASRPDSWFAGPQGRQAADNILTWQDNYGAWPKNNDNTAEPYRGDRAGLKGTFDNGATCNEMRFLARTYKATHEDKYRQAFIKGLEVIMVAQYPSGGWPQFYPLSKQYHRHITFNDGSMIRVMELFQEIAAGKGYEFVPEENRQAAGRAVTRGIECIINCQIVVNGKRTAWCAQHDEITLAPAAGRSYELPSISGAESAGILKFLMKLPEPNNAVAAAIEAGAVWYESARIDGIRLETIDGARRAVADPQAKPLWARFYEIETNRPLFSSRDGVKQFDYNQIDLERRNGYSWYGDWGSSLLSDYRKWDAKRTKP